MARRRKADLLLLPAVVRNYDKYFTNELEETLVLSAKLKTSDHFKFNQTPKLDPYRKTGTPVPNKMLYEVPCRYYP